MLTGDPNVQGYHMKPREKCREKSRNDIGNGKHKEKTHLPFSLPLWISSTILPGIKLQL
jgi:hypothetical protein